MANGISLFDLERLSRKYNLRIWQCRRTGRRWAFVNGFGEEKVLPSFLIFENSETGIFIQADSSDHPALKQEIIDLLGGTALC